MRSGMRLQCRARAAVFTIVALCLTLFRIPAYAVLPDGIDIVHGVATTKNGLPLAHVTLYFLALPVTINGISEDLRETSVETDDTGHFTWHVPAKIVWLVNRKTAPSCWSFAAPTSIWRYAPVIRGSGDSDGMSLLNRTASTCTARWGDSLTGPILYVTGSAFGTVALSIRSPDGTPLRSHGVQVFDPAEGSDGTLVYTLKTDAAGRLTLPLAPGRLRLRVLVPGVGFASTGIFPVVANRVAASTIPPLARFGSISGTVALPPTRSTTAFNPTATVRLDEWNSEHQWYQSKATVDGAGKWKIPDVLPGTYRVLRTGSQELEVTVLPGEEVRGIRLLPAPSASPETASISPHQNGLNAVRGRVTDGEGHPVPGATVYAECGFNGVRRYVHKFVTTADSEGRYQIELKGLPDWADVEAALILATHPGFGTAQATNRMIRHSDGSLELSEKQAVIDVVLPSATAGINVHVLQEGRPLSGATVRLRQDDGTGIEEVPAIDDASKKILETLKSISSPTATTGADGVAHFEALSPGCWSIDAIVGTGVRALDRRRLIWREPSDPFVFGTAANIALQVGPTRDFTLNVYNQPDETAFKMVDLGGGPPQNREITAETVPPTETWASQSRITVDADGNGSVYSRAPGIWRLTGTFPEKTVDAETQKTHSITAGDSYYAGDTLVAVSPALTGSLPVTIRAKHIGLGNLKVRLLDAGGHPARGSVGLSEAYQGDRYAASSDANGVAVFSQIPCITYTVYAGTGGSRLPPLGVAGEPLPSQAALTGVMFLPPQDITVQPDRETVLTLRPLPQGYIRGHIKVKDRIGDYTMDVSDTADKRTGYHFNADTGDFVAGPFRGDKADIWLYRYSSGPHPHSDVWHAQTAVRRGAVAEVTLVEEGIANEPTNAVVLRPLVRDQIDEEGSWPPAGTVLQNDGVTPAWGAEVAFFMSRDDEPRWCFSTDAAGHLSQWERWTPLGQKPAFKLSLEGEAKPSFLVRLPGTTGATVVPYAPGQPLRVILPPAIACHGKITVAGKTVQGLHSSFRIFAAYEGTGRFNPFLSVETTAQADGSFELDGLTAGTYRIQATRDGIWLSRSQTLTVSRDTNDLTFDIPEPGQPMDLHLLDPVGKPMPGAVVAISHPDGPLTEELWPHTLTADETGRLHLEGLAVGPLTLALLAPETAADPAHSKRVLGTFTIDIPAYAAGTAPLDRDCRLTTPLRKK